MKKKEIIKRFIFYLLVFIAFSCSKENNNPNIYNFDNINFIGHIKNYNNQGQLLNNDTIDFESQDFLFSKNFIFPFDQIEIINNSFIGKYFNNEAKEPQFGSVFIHLDSIFFESDNYNNDAFTFKAVNRNDSLIFQGFGVKYIYDNYSGGIHSKGYISSVKLGIPDIKNISADPGDFPWDSSIYKGLYIQEFEYIYIHN